MTNEQQGRIVKWQEGRGFGMIETDAGESVFFHVSEFLAPRRPKVGEQVVFTIGQDSQGRQHAQQVQELGFVPEKVLNKNKHIRHRNSQHNQQRSHQADFQAGQKKRLLLGVGFYAVLIILAVMGKLSWLVIGWYALLGLITYLTYAKDKNAAQCGKWRTPEATLHILSTLGGWVGALVAQTYLRHKSQKYNFRMIYYLTVGINLAVLMVVVLNK